MNNQSYEITVDTRKSISHSNIEFSQNNLNISELIFNITEDGKEFPLNDTDKIIVYFEKSDKTVVFQDKEVKLLDKAKGKIKVLLTSQTLVKAGDVKGQISIERIEGGTKKRANTYDFSFKVRSSIASNDSIESTNEFQIFDKIIEAGEKLEGVDIDRIIAAGAKADAALPKTGGTLTGDLTIKKDNAGFQVKNNNDVGLAHLVGATGEYYWYSTVNKTPLKYNVSSDTLTVNSATNLLKKAGDTMTGPLVLDSAPTIRGVGATFDMRPYNGTVYSKGFRHTVNTANNYYAVAPIDENGAATWSNQLQFDGADGTLTVSNLKTRKDGRTNIPLSSEATAPDVNYILAAVRVNNVVTLKGAVTLNANATGVIVATLPPDLKPAGGNLSIYTPTADLSTNVQVFVNGTSGAVAFSSNAKGKRVDFVITYVI